MRNLIQASEAHLGDCRYRGLAPATLYLYELCEQAFIDYLNERELPLALHALNQDNVRNAAQWIQARGTGKRGGEAMKRTFVVILKTWSRWLVAEDILEADYLGRLRRPKVTDVARKAYEPWEIQAIRGALAQTVTATRDVTILRLLLDTGMRIQECTELRLSDVDLEARRVFIRSGKGHRERVVPFGSAEERDGGPTVRQLRTWLRARRVNPHCAKTDQDALWMTYDGYPMSKAAFQSAFRRAAVSSGVSHSEVHALRHTFAVRHLVRRQNAQTAIDELRYLLGHVSNNTYRVYIGQAAQILAEVNGGESIADSMMRPGPKVPITPRPPLSLIKNGVGPPRGVTVNGAAPPNPGRRDGNRTASQAPRRRPAPLA